MKRIVSFLALTAFCVLSYAQEPVLTYNGELYFIPGSMTKSGEPFLISTKYADNDGFTIYDGDFNIVKTFLDPAKGQPYQQRVVTKTRIYELETGGSVTRSDDEWTVVNDQTYEYTTSSVISSFELFSDNNNYHSRNLYVTQTLFDDDEDFEYVRLKQTIVPVSQNLSDYIQEHSTSSGVEIYPSTGDEFIDSIMRATGAENYDRYYDYEKGKNVLNLYKNEYYGGLFNEGLEIATLDGKVKAFLPGITYISSAYYYRGKCYVKGYGSDNSYVLYQLGNNATGIRELSRAKARVVVRRVGNNLEIESDSDGQQTVVMSTMDGRVVRSLVTKRGTNQLPLSGLSGGVYNVTLYQQAMPVKSSKIVIKQ